MFEDSQIAKNQFKLLQSRNKIISEQKPTTPSFSVIVRIVESRLSESRLTEVLYYPK